jgi:hypothetical protein
MSMKAKFTSLCLAASLLFISPMTAKAVSSPVTSSTTTVSIVLPDCIILHYYSSLTLNFSAYANAVNEGGPNAWNVQWSGAADGGSQLSSSNIQVSQPNLVSLTIPNAWAIRGLSPSGNAKVTIAVVNNTLTSGTSKITIQNGSGDTVINDNAGHSGASITTSLNGIGTTQATIGNVIMTLDFSQTNKAGAHTGGQYKITAETI